MKAIIKLDYKLIGKSPGVMISMLCSILLFFLLAAGLAGQAEERSSMPIGIVDRDHTEKSLDLLKGLSGNQALYVYEKPEEELLKMLKEESILAYLVIPEGYQERLTQGQAESLLTIHYLDSSRIAVLAADLAAGEIMYELCLGKSLNLYLSLSQKGGLLSETQYREAVKKIKDSGQYNYGFQIEMIDVNSRSGKAETIGFLENQLIYNQIIVGMAGIVLSFLAMFLAGDVWGRLKDLTGKRILISSMPNWKIYGGHILSMISILFLYSAAGTFFLAASGKMPSGALGFFRIFMIQVLAGLAFLVFFIFLNNIIGSHTAYQLAGGIFVIFSGGLGIAGLLMEGLLNLSKFMPNYWCIQVFTDIIKYMA